MSENSKIQWTDDTYNAWRGCTKVSAGCKNCYAERLITTRLRHVHYEAATSGGKRTSKQFHATGGPAGSGIQFWGEGSPRIRAVDLDEPLRWNKKPSVRNHCGKAFDVAQTHECVVPRHGYQDFHRRRVFSLSLGDWLDPEVPIEWLADFLDVVRRCENLDWLLVTKRPELFWGSDSAAKYVPGRLQSLQESLQDSPFKRWLCLWGNGHPPANVMVIASVENQEVAETRIPALLKIPAARRGLSCEPLLGMLDLKLIRVQDKTITIKEKIDWVISGCESGTDRRELDGYTNRARCLLDQCRSAGVPFFHKQMPLGKRVSGDMAEWPQDLQVREFYK